MPQTNAKYWKALEERDERETAVSAADEFQPPPVQLGRRDFLKAAGFTAALAAGTGCARAPVQKALPLLNQPETIVPGRPLYYASTCGGCSAGCGTLVKVRDGRPIKLEGNPQHPLSRGGLCAVGQASILGLYDSHRLRRPLRRGAESDWKTVDGEIAAKLAEIAGRGGAVRFLSGTVTSPTLQARINEFLGGFKDGKHVIYDPLSRSAILEAHRRLFGIRALPRYRFDRADVIAGFDADFLATFLSPVEFTEQYRDGRNLEAKRVSYHVQFEPRLSLTGSKADRRFAVRPDETGSLLTQLVARLARASGEKFDAPITPDVRLDDLAKRLGEARGRSLVISGSNDVAEQSLAAYANQLLGNYGATLDLDRPSLQAQGDDAELATLLGELRQNKVEAILLSGVNPAFDLPNGAEMAALIQRVPLSVSFAARRDETAEACQYVCPESHYLESWSDAQAVAGSFAVQQPVIDPLGGTRTVVASLATWRGQPLSAYDAVRAYWRGNIFPGQPEKDFDKFWDRAVHDGYVEIAMPPAKRRSFDVAAVQPIAPRQTDGMALVLYPSIAMLDGRNAYNPWLHELPDPISKTAWDNVASLAPATAALFGIEQGDIVRIAADGGTLELPAYIQPGQHEQAIAVALGYGSKLSERFAQIGPQWLEAQSTVGDDGRVGRNAAPLLRFADGSLRYDNVVRVQRTGKRRELACTQLHGTLTVPPKLAPPGATPRAIVQETTLAAFFADPHSGVEDHAEKEDLWPTDHPYTGPRWGMVVDLNACTGCSACVIACQAENNIPVVGRDEVRRNREMHWLRIDRYYSEPSPGIIEVAHQPLPCQQCENAPCETVCPVLATVHTDDGLNAQVYNRCVGTRYCANNCPYKGRRFNWFNYSHDDQLQNLQLNPDVTVRSRGVMEKCTFCVQRIQLAKIEAKTRGEKIADGDVQSACQQSCPARAIHFGDLNDPNSSVSRRMADPRRYRLLSELNVKPAVGYLTVVRNREDEKEGNNG